MEYPEGLCDIGLPVKEEPLFLTDPQTIENSEATDDSSNTTETASGDGETDSSRQGSD